MRVLNKVWGIEKDCYYFIFLRQGKLGEKVNYGGWMTWHQWAGPRFLSRSSEASGNGRRCHPSNLIRGNFLLDCKRARDPPLEYRFLLI